jgi:aspartate racemase
VCSSDLVSLPPERQEAFMVTLYRIKAGDLGDDVTREMKGYAEELRKLGAEVLIAGCTEVPLVLEDDDVKLELIDPGDLLARRCVAVCLRWEPLPHGVS